MGQRNIKTKLKNIVTLCDSKCYQPSWNGQGDMKSRFKMSCQIYNCDWSVVKCWFHMHVGTDHGQHGRDIPKLVESSVTVQ